MIAIETEQHRLRAADFDLFLKQGQVWVAGWGGQRFSKSTGELVGEVGEGQLLALDTALSDAEQVIGRDAVHPRTECAFAAKSAQVAYHLHQDLLTRILCILGVP